MSESEEKGDLTEVHKKPVKSSQRVRKPVEMKRKNVVFVAIVAVVCAVLGAVWMPSFLERLTSTSLFETHIEYSRFWYTGPAMGILGLIVGAGLGRLIQQVYGKTFGRWDKIHIGDKVDLFLGIFGGLIASFPFLSFFQGQTWGIALTVTLTIGFSAVSIYALKSISEVLPWHRSAGLKRSTGIKVLDTNVLIDGRLYDIVTAGFLQGEMYVPKFVLKELQFIADSPDSLRRQRGRRGLEILRLLQADFDVEVGTYDRFSPDPNEEVDSRLVMVTKAIGGELVSNDFNLNRVASIQDVRVLNINDLALAVRTPILPGEAFDLAIIRTGNQQGQGVGYLDDGTMVVVDDAEEKVGETAHVWVTQVIQTERGKMIFASQQKPGADRSRNGR
jgi:uncharacterized protein YacL